MAHNKVYAYCENYCKEETMTKEQIQEAIDAIDLTPYKLKGDFAVLTGKYTFSGSLKYGTLELNYPTGFNKNNCVLISANILDQQLVQHYRSELLVPTSGIMVELYNNYLGATVYSNDADVTECNVQIVLMKIN